MHRIDEHEWDWLRRASPVLDETAGAGPRHRHLSERILATKSIEGAGGFEIDREVELLIAGHCAIPVLNLGLDWYAGWRSIIVYAGGFRTVHEYVDEFGVAHHEVRELSGEAWPRGPVIVSWEAMEESLTGAQAGDVLIHELAHKLDLLEDGANGAPPVHLGVERDEWTAVLSAAFTDFNHRLDHDEPVVLDPSAGDDAGEFFAVMSEAFFCEPDELNDTYPALYLQLSRFYRQDPGRLITNASWCTPLPGA